MLPAQSAEIALVIWAALATGIDGEHLFALDSW
jgi:hypothetical protein